MLVASTGRFEDRERASGQLKRGVKTVLITAMAQGADCTLVMGVNKYLYAPRMHQIVSNASCTSNCLGVVVKVLNETFGIERGFMTTIHSYTNDQRLLDLPHKGLRRARSAGLWRMRPTGRSKGYMPIRTPPCLDRLPGQSHSAIIDALSTRVAGSGWSRAWPGTRMNGATPAACAIW